MALTKVTRDLLNTGIDDNSTSTAITIDSSQTVVIGPLNISASGPLGLSGANYGTSGQVLTSNGGSSAPSWQDAGGGSIDGTTINPSSVQIGGTTVIDSSRNVYANYSVLGRSIRTSDRGELHLNATGATDVTEVFFGYGDGHTDANIRWGISDRGSNDDRLVIYKGPYHGGFTQVAAFDATSNRLRTTAGYEIADGNTIISEGSGNSVRVQTDSGNVDIGPMNTVYCHLQTDRPAYYFNKRITVDEGIVDSYNEDLQLRRASSSTDKLTIGSGHVSTPGYLRASRLYAAADGTAGYFFNDSGTRTAYAGGDFYIQSISNYYNYATSQYMGNTSGDTMYLRGNRMTHNGWDFQADGHIRMYDNKHIRFGSGGDAEFFCNGSHMYIDLNSGIGNLYIRDGSTTRYTFNDNGSFTATGNITAYSDRRVKDQFEPITDALAKVQQLNGQTYVRTDMDDDARRYAGLIAQDVEAVLPEAVTEIEDHLALDYSGTIALLVEAVKELKQEVNDLKAQLEDR